MCPTPALRWLHVPLRLIAINHSIIPFLFHVPRDCLLMPTFTLAGCFTPTSRLCRTAAACGTCQLPPYLAVCRLVSCLVPVRFHSRGLLPTTSPFLANAPQQPRAPVHFRAPRSPSYHAPKCALMCLNVLSMAP
jgi:hypothetical protein